MFREKLCTRSQKKKKEITFENIHSSKYHIERRQMEILNSGKLQTLLALIKSNNVKEQSQGIKECQQMVALGYNRIIKRVIITHKITKLLFNIVERCKQMNMMEMKMNILKIYCGLAICNIQQLISQQLISYLNSELVFFTSNPVKTDFQLQMLKMEMKLYQQISEHESFRQTIEDNSHFADTIMKIIKQYHNEAELICGYHILNNIFHHVQEGRFEILKLLVDQIQNGHMIQQVCLQVTLKNIQIFNRQTEQEYVPQLFYQIIKPDHQLLFKLVSILQQFNGQYENISIASSIMLILSQSLQVESNLIIKFSQIGLLEQITTLLLRYQNTGSLKCFGSVVTIIGHFSTGNAEIVDKFMKSHALSQVFDRLSTEYCSYEATQLYPYFINLQDEGNPTDVCDYYQKSRVIWKYLNLIDDLQELEIQEDNQEFFLRGIITILDYAILHNRGEHFIEMVCSEDAQFVISKMMCTENSIIEELLAQIIVLSENNEKE